MRGDARRRCVMRERVDILIIGAGPAGLVCAMTARKYYPRKKILLMRSIEKGVIPCGIPYMFASLPNPDDNVLGMAALEKSNVRMMVDEAVRISRGDKCVETRSGATLHYEKLILATGSLPVIPRVPGINKKGVYPVYKELGYLRKCIDEVKKSRHVLILGGGFIGVEFADEISKMEGVSVSLVELLPHVLSNSFDAEFSLMVEERLRAKGVTVLTGAEVVELTGGERVRGVRFADGSEADVGSVILGIGAVPDTRLAVEAGLDLGKGKGIWVDEYMRTADPDIFAIGDCAGKRDFYTRKDAPVMLASTATAEARIAGANLYELKVVRENKGTIAIYSTVVDGLVLGSAGLTENSARREGFQIAVGVAEGMDKHPPTLPGASRILVKLIFSKKSGILMGGQVAGGICCGEVINLIGVAIQQRVSATELETLQMATHPCLTSSPTMYPVIRAAQAASAEV